MICYLAKWLLTTLRFPVTNTSGEKTKQNKTLPFYLSLVLQKERKNPKYLFFQGSDNSWISTVTRTPHYNYVFPSHHKIFALRGGDKAKKRKPFILILPIMHYPLLFRAFGCAQGLQGSRRAPATPLDFI